MAHKRTANVILSELIPVAYVVHGEVRVSKAAGNDNVRSRDYGIYVGLVNELYFLKPDFAQTVGKNFFNLRVNSFFEERGFVEDMVSEKEADAWVKKITDIPVFEVRVFAELSGVMLCFDEPVQLGPYMLYDASRHMKSLLDHSYNSNLKECLDDESAILLRVNVLVRDLYAASDVAAPLFEQFERTVSFMMNNRTVGSGAKVSTMLHAPLIVTYACAPDGQLIKGRKRADMGHYPEMDDSYFTDPRLGHDFIWKLLATKSRSDVEKRIMSTVDWIGQALLDKSAANRLLKAAIAIESLFSIGKDYMNKSLTAQLSECVAQVMGDDLLSRIRIEKEVKELYKLRSAVVHGIENSTDLQQANRLVELAAECLHRFITCRSLRAIKTDDQLRNYFNSLRFAGATAFVDGTVA